MIDLDIFKPKNPSVPPSRRQQPKPKRQTEPFVQVPMVLVAKAVDSLSSLQEFAVLLHILHICWLEKSRRVRITSFTLAALGVDRSAKRRALHKLEQAGFVSVERQSGKNPWVTLQLN